MLKNEFPTGRRKISPISRTVSDERGVSRIDSIISDMYYVIDCLRALDEITKSGNCNTCGVRTKCQYAPPVGKLIRYNCPFFKDVG